MDKERIATYKTEVVNTPSSTLEIPRDKRGRIRWKVLQTNPDQLAAFIENQVHSLLDQGIKINRNSLTKVGFSYLSSGIIHYYPNGYTGLRQALDLPLGYKPRNYWAGTEGIDRIQREVKIIYQEEGAVNGRILRAKGKPDVARAIDRTYPGGWRKLRENLAITPSSKPHGFWTPENIKQEAAKFYAEHGGLSRSLLHRAGRTDLETVVRKYPGGLVALKREFGVKFKARPHGFWTIDTIRMQAMEFYSQFASLTPNILREKGRGDLHIAARKYPGGVRQLQRDLNIPLSRKDAGYWTREKIKEEARTFYEQYGNLTHTILKRNGRNALVIAIRNYPGKIRQLQTDLGILSPKRPNGYWTEVNIECEAREFLEKYGELTFTVLHSHRNFRLHRAIRRLYPGGLTTLREKLGLVTSIQELNLSSDQANEQLRRLLEEE